MPEDTGSLLPWCFSGKIGHGHGYLCCSTFLNEMGILIRTSSCWNPWACTKITLTHCRTTRGWGTAMPEDTGSLLPWCFSGKIGHGHGYLCCSTFLNEMGILIRTSSCWNPQACTKITLTHCRTTRGWGTVMPEDTGSLLPWCFSGKIGHGQGYLCCSTFLNEMGMLVRTSSCWNPWACTKITLTHCRITRGSSGPHHFQKDQVALCSKFRLSVNMVHRWVVGWKKKKNWAAISWTSEFWNWAKKKHMRSTFQCNHSYSSYYITELRNYQIRDPWTGKVP